MKQANPLILASRMPRHPGDVLLSPHALERALERTRLEPSHVRALIAERRCVVLPLTASDTTSERTYHLFWDRNAQSFFVAVVALGRSADPCAHVVTVLTRAQFEHDAGAISARFLRTAASRVLDPVAFRQWESREFCGRRIRKNYRVIAYYRASEADGTMAPNTGHVSRVVLRNPPICDEFVQTYSLSRAASHPGFWNWFSREATRVGLPVERVVSMRIADTDKEFLDVSAPLLPCPCCAAGQQHRAIH
ncbi:MAG: hypothetical protein EPN77_19435 [Candidimonas sp.]|nr:hypothetical protein [Betaproteobacteria bacterium]TAL80713.1 MAG: hypothetical protein EPN77_19435 [Candidimonas sp.]